MNKLLVAGVVVVAVLLVAGYFGGYLVFFKGGVEQEKGQQEEREVIVVIDGLILSAPTTHDRIEKSHAGSFEAEPGLVVPAFFYDVGMDGTVIAPSPGTVYVGKHFTGLDQLRLRSGDYDVYILLNNALIMANDSLTTGPALPLAVVGQEIEKADETNLVLYVKNLSDGQYLNISEHPRMVYAPPLAATG